MRLRELSRVKFWDKTQWRLDSGMTGESLWGSLRARLWELGHGIQKINQQNKNSEKTMSRIIILLLDSFGVGASFDAHTFGDENANTLASLFKHRQLNIPNFAKLGLYHILLASSGVKAPDFDPALKPTAQYGYAVSQSVAKDTLTGHWEICGVPLLNDWNYFPREYPSFPTELTDDLIKSADLPGILGNRHASGTQIIEEHGGEHITSGKPIVYTSGDSVFQIAAHEKHFGLEKLYALCEIAREKINPHRIARVIARPFIGSDPKNFSRTANRRDYCAPPPSKTLLEKFIDSDGTVIGIGKIHDIFSGRGITQRLSGKDNDDLFSKTVEALKSAADRSLIFTNLVDFDTKYGHRRDIDGYTNALEALDKRLPELINGLKKGDRLIITADHGCDPAFEGSDHTREHVPVMCVASSLEPEFKPEFIRRRESFADIGQSIARFFACEALDYGTAWDL